VMESHSPQKHREFTEKAEILIPTHH